MSIKPCSACGAPRAPARALCAHDTLQRHAQVLDWHLPPCPADLAGVICPGRFLRLPLCIAPSYGFLGDGRTRLKVCAECYHLPSCHVQTAANKGE